ncbi:MAG: GNAT family N-acetyltransferase [Francisellaceae bacterium]
MIIKVANKIRLELIQAKDVESIFALTSANRLHLLPWMPWAGEAFSRAGIEQFVKLAEQQHKDNRALNFKIIYRDNYVGNISYNQLDHTLQTAIIGYWLARNYNGLGIMSCCVTALLDYGFNVLNMNKIRINCATQNSKSRAIPERLGFHLDGILRAEEKVGGVFFDHAVYSMLKQEYVNRFCEA